MFQKALGIDYPKKEGITRLGLLIFSFSLLGWSAPNADIPPLARGQ